MSHPFDTLTPDLVLDAVESTGFISDARVLALLDKLIKQRKDSATQYRDAGRPELAETEEAEILVLQEFLRHRPASLPCRHHAAHRDARGEGRRGVELEVVLQDCAQLGRVHRYGGELFDAADAVEQQPVLERLRRLLVR